MFRMSKGTSRYQNIHSSHQSQDLFVSSKPVEKCQRVIKYEVKNKKLKVSNKNEKIFSIELDLL